MKVALAALSAPLILPLSVRSDILVSVDPAVELGPVKAMNAVNNGPSRARADQSRGNFAEFKALRVPYARTHDSINQATSNGHTVDISAVFPDFDADENNPASYDFAYTDKFLETIIAAGTRPFFRLGQTIENGIKKYHVFPPKDYAKWARICEHVIRHCNEGWCGGHEWGIEYWEIWNEPDAELDENRAKSCQWQGTKAQFFEFYKVVAQHLKRQFPKLRIGGPALGWRPDWTDEFLGYQRAAGTEIDFFSWHDYRRRPDGIVEKAARFRGLLDKHGYDKAESILDEWNYVKGWTADFPYTARAISAAKGGAFAAAYMSLCQDAPVDMLMYYDARPGTIFNGLFDYYTYAPRPAYYALFSWADLRELGKQVKATVEKGGITNEVVTAVAARNGKRDLGIFIARFADDDNVTAVEKATVRIVGGTFDGRIRGYLTDESRLGSPVHLEPDQSGAVSLALAPNAFVYIETRCKEGKGAR